MSRDPSFAVVATVDEPAPAVLAFVHHHLAIGAAEVFVFLDTPNPEVEDHLRGLAGVHLARCDDAWWAARGQKRFKLHPARQIFNANLALAQTRADWLLHCDCDEFVRDAAPLVADLREKSQGRVWMRLSMAERAYRGGDEDFVYDGVFRAHIEKYEEFGPDIYGAMMPYLRHGLTGHKAGKPVLRTGVAGVKLGIHFPEGHHPHLVAPSLKLLHFDGFTRLHFLLKVLRRVHEPPASGPPRHNPARLAQMAALSDIITTPEEAAAFVALVKQLDKGQLAGLKKLGLLDERRFVPQGNNPLADRLAVPAFDGELRRRYADFIAAHAPGLLA